MTIDQLTKGNALTEKLLLSRKALAQVEKLTPTCDNWSASMRQLSIEQLREIKDLIKRTIQRKITILETELHTL